MKTSTLVHKAGMSIAALAAAMKACGKAIRNTARSARTQPTTDTVIARCTSPVLVKRNDDKGGQEQKAACHERPRGVGLEVGQQCSHIRSGHRRSGDDDKERAEHTREHARPELL